MADDLQAKCREALLEVCDTTHHGYWIDPNDAAAACARAIEAAIAGAAAEALGPTREDWDRVRLLAVAALEDPVSAPESNFGDPMGPAWQRGEIFTVDPSERYVEMACCGFRYSADHLNANGSYTCPLCEPPESGAALRRTP